MTTFFFPDLPQGTPDHCLLRLFGSLRRVLGGRALLLPGRGHRLDAVGLPVTRPQPRVRPLPHVRAPRRLARAVRGGAVLRVRVLPGHRRRRAGGAQGQAAHILRVLL